MGHFQQPYDPSSGSCDGHGVPDTSTGRDPSPLSRSLTESIRTVYKENGRTYHSYRAGSYPFPNDEEENERLELQYTALKEAMGGRNYLAPFTGENPPRDVLDIGTGPGQWALEVADEFPEATVIGTDLSPSTMPDFVPENLKLYVEDANDEWDYEYPFDFIHTRMTFSCWSDMKSQVIEKAMRHLHPGGWLECQETHGIFQCDDGSIPPGFAPNLWAHNMQVAGDAGRIQMGIAPKMAGWFREAGFIDVQEVILRLPVGAWDRTDDHQRVLGALWLKNLDWGLSSITMALFHRYLGMTKEQIEVFLVDVRKGIRNPSIHSYQTLYVVWGRKPRPGEKADGAEKKER
ncbi:hypothetical protein GGTG_00923 [Gaeumannomyces tritici R3-111a-1]|uniref:Methyltransferase n=1 Tax=Gaeumannomyces tritici (strain R3-111a-1) TaxID=644352 RepID=J3NI40_GAET3|nr:hypothetical protein GGTG_00923 [Gaeumannomyces tritici R3-111a-1]EJT80933.1 hypothetical protein GGTG_00923 [Gaeumannomyces tritici R3-111a-1]